MKLNEVSLSNCAIIEIMWEVRAPLDIGALHSDPKIQDHLRKKTGIKVPPKASSFVDKIIDIIVDVGQSVEIKDVQRGDKLSKISFYIPLEYVYGKNWRQTADSIVRTQYMMKLERAIQTLSPDLVVQIYTN